MLDSKWASQVGSFNPRPCVRGDTTPLDAVAGGELFQSTPLCEGRQLLCYQIDLLVVLGCLALTVVVGRGLMGICCWYEEFIDLFQWNNKALTS